MVLGPGFSLNAQAPLLSHHQPLLTAALAQSSSQDPGWPKVWSVDPEPWQGGK